MTRANRLNDRGATLARLILAAALAVPGAVLAQVPTPKPSPARPQTDEAARAWEAMPLADRIAVQDGLVWSGDYAGALDGTFGRMTFEAITAFQARHKLPADGIVTPPFSKLLGETAAPRRGAVGFQPVDDKATGVRIHLPTRLLGPATKREGGTRWVGREGRVQVDTYAFADDDLAGLFERMKADQPGRRVTYAVLRPDWFVIADDVGGRRGYMRFARGAQGIRGFVFAVDAALAPELDRVVIATAGRFEPFPGTPATPAAPGPGPQARNATPPAATTTAPPATPAGASPAAAASALLIAPGKAVAPAAAVAGCRTLTVAGRAATVATADAGGIATLTFAASGPAPAGALRLAAGLDAPLTVIADGDVGGRAGAVAVPAEAADGRVRAALQRGGQGGAVIAANGALAGLVAGRPDESRAVTGLVLAASYEVAAADALAAAVEAAGGTVQRVVPGATVTTGRIVADWAPRVVAVDCRR